LHDSSQNHTESRVDEMKLLKLAIAAAVSGLFVGAGMVARAVVPDTYYTYSFKADAQDNSFDGSTITIDATTGAITAWDLVDESDGPAPIELSSALANSQINYYNVASAGASTWAGYFSIGNVIYQPSFTSDYSAQISDTFLGNSDGTGSIDGGYLGDTFTDPGGLWSAAGDPVPDALNSLQLLALALAGLGASHLFFRRQPAVLTRN
jgi:hypothetical protein